MSDAVMSAVTDQLGALSQSQSHPLSVVLHGGEPLLLGIDTTERFIEGLKSSLRVDAGLHIQTNGVLLTDEFIDIFDRYDVGISISLDGPAELHDRNRLDRHGDGSHERVVAALLGSSRTRRVSDCSVDCSRLSIRRQTLSRCMNS